MTDHHAEHLLYRLSAGAGSAGDQHRAAAMIIDLCEAAARAEAQTRRLRRQVLWLALFGVVSTTLAAAQLLGWLP